MHGQQLYPTHSGAADAGTAHARAPNAGSDPFAGAGVQQVRGRLQNVVLAERQVLLGCRRPEQPVHVRAEHRISLRVGDPVHGLQMHYLHPDRLCPATAHACAADAAADAGSTHTVARHFDVVSDVTTQET